MVTPADPPSFAPAARVVLTHLQAGALLRARADGAESLLVSTDLGRSEQRAELRASEIQLANGELVSWQQLEHIAESDSVCFLLEAGEALPIRSYSEAHQRAYQLYPTEQGPPALLLSGFVMHRIRDVDPFEGAARMVRALGPLRGRLLDTCTGLGYAAIVASRTASQVVTLELDPAVRDVAAQNPWSRELFETPRIELAIGDSAEKIREFSAGEFSAVLHDPPAINLAGELYSAAFYSEVKRVLAKSGKFFHYIGDPNSASGGRVTRGVLKRLRDAGFTRVTPRPEAFGVLASP